MNMKGVVALKCGCFNGFWQVQDVEVNVKLYTAISDKIYELPYSVVQLVRGFNSITLARGWCGRPSVRYRRWTYWWIFFPIFSFAEFVFALFLERGEVVVC